MRFFPEPMFASSNVSSVNADDLPKWDLKDLYESPQTPKLTADLDQIARDVSQFGKDYRGQLSTMVAHVDASALIGAAVQKYEALQDLMGRVMSYAGLLYSSNTSDPDHAKFYGDMQEKITNASAQLLFFQLELNRLEDIALMDAAKMPPLSRWRPWLEDIRKEKPHELDDKIEELFHEKYISGAAAWNRLFDETIASLRFKVAGNELAIEPVLNILQDPNEEKRREAALAVGETLKDNLRIFSLITNTLAKDKEISDRWRGFDDVADARHLSNRVERDVVAALSAAVEDAHPRLSHRYYKLKAKWFGKEKHSCKQRKICNTN